MTQLGALGEQERIPDSKRGKFQSQVTENRKPWLQIKARRRAEERRGRWRWDGSWHVVAVTAKERTHGGEGLVVEKVEWDLTIHAIDIPMRTKPGPRVGGPSASSCHRQGGLRFFYFYIL